MTETQILLVCIVFIPLIAAALDKIRMDLAALMVAASLGLLQLAGVGILGNPGDTGIAIRAISGFSQPTIITLISLFILSRGLEKIGAMRWITLKIFAAGKNSEARLIALYAGITALFSLIMNNVAAGALVLPGALETSRHTGIKPSKLLMPVAYGSMLGGAATYFTTANIVMSDLLRIAKPPQATLSMIDFLPTGSLIIVLGVAYLATLGRKRLPDRSPGIIWTQARLSCDEMEDFFQLSDQLWEAAIESGSPLVGKTLAETYIGERFGLVVAGLQHGITRNIPPLADSVLTVGDRLLIVGQEESVRQLSVLGVQAQPPETIRSVSNAGGTLFEVVLSPHSAAQGKTLKDLDFRNQYGFTAFALRRMDQVYRTNIGEIPLAFGDVLLVAGAPNRLRVLKKSLDFFLLEPDTEEETVSLPLRWFTGLLFAGAIAASIMGIPAYLATLTAAILLIASGAIRMDEAYQSIEWQAIFIIAGMYAVSIAMVETGLAQTLGQAFIQLVNQFGPLGLAAGSYILTGLLTQIMGGQVAALVTGPVTISAAINMGVNPQAVAVATAIGCSAAFLTPLAHPVNILMITPGNYRFRDFFRVGWPLTLISLLALLVGLKIFWQL